MQVISEEKINEIRMNADIVSIISNYVPLKMQGRNYFGICPFHNDHNPSMSVSKDKGLYKCFVCNKGGDVFNFVKDYENITYPEAIKKVADIVGIPLEYNNTVNRNTENDKYYEIMEYANKIFQNNLNSEEGSNAIEYLNSRSITKEIIKEFNIGLSLSDNKYLYNNLSKKYDINILDSLGLITKDGINGYDKFVKRIMIPITNEFGNVVGFTGRIYNNEDSAKYINSKETIIYKKGNIIFNYFNAKKYIKNEKCAILVEGNMDAIRMSSSGIKNVLALMGTEITKEQINILKKLRVPIILMLDNDNAGEIATNNVGDYLIKEGIEVKVVRLSGTKDPDEYIVKYGIDKFRDVINSSIYYIDYKLKYLKGNKDLSNGMELSNYINEVMKMLNNYDKLTREITLKKIYNEYPYQFIKEEIENNNNTQENIVIKINKEEKVDKYNILVNKIFCYLFSNDKYIEIFKEKLGYLRNRIERELLSEIEYYINKHKKIDYSSFLAYINTSDEISSDIVEFVNNISSNIDIEDLDDNIFINYVKNIKNIMNKDEIKKLKNDLKNELDINKQLEISKRIIELKKDVV